LGGAPRGWHQHPRPPARRGRSSDISRRRKKGEAEQAEWCALGRSRGGWGSKLHIRVEGSGTPVAIELTAGQRNENPVFERLMDHPMGVVRHPHRRGRPKRRPRAVGGDKGYTGRRIRGWLRGKGIRAIIPRRRDESRRGTRFDRATYRTRERVERCINRLKQCRRVATRYEKLAAHYLAMVTIAAILIWL
jgi:transposase